MAEFVEALTEKTIDSLDQLVHIGILSEQEAKNVIKTRQAHEYRLARRTKKKDDYTRYIQFEINFLEMIRLRRQKTRNFGRPQLDYEQINRIHALFRGCIFRFQEDVEMWLSHIAFSKKHRQSASAGRIYKRMLQVHPRRTDLWLDAASWEVESKQYDAARKIYLTALRFNKTDRNLWIAYQRFEVQQCMTARKFAAEDKQKEKTDLEAALEATQEFPEAVTDGRLAVLAFKKGVEANPNDDSLIVKFLDAWRENADHELAKLRVEELFNLLDLTDQHPELVAAWCRRPMIGIMPGFQLECAKEVLSRFDEKLSAMSISPEFRSLHVRFILESINNVAPKPRCENETNPERAFFLSKIKILIENASELKVTLSEEVLADSFDLLDAESYILPQDVYEAAVKSYSKSKRLWLNLFSSFTAEMMKSSKQSLLAAVNECFTAPFGDTVKGKEDAIAVWHAAIQLCILYRLPVDQLDKIWQKAASLHLGDLGSLYLDWAYHQCALAESPWKALQRAFTLVSGTSVKRPLPLSLHMARLKYAISTYDVCSRYAQMEECAQFVEIDAKAVRKIFDEALLDVGNGHLNLWLMYVRFENLFGNIESLTHVAWRARHFMPANLLGEFNSAYTEITSNSVSSSFAQVPSVKKMQKS